MRQEPATVDMGGSRMELVVRIGPPAGDIVLLRVRLKPNSMVPLHSHSDPEGFYVLSGCMEVFLDDDRPGWRVVKSGEGISPAVGLRHAVRTGPEGVDLILTTNNRLATFFLEAGTPVSRDAPNGPPTPEALDRIARVAEKFDYWLASATESAAVITKDACQDLNKACLQ